MEGLVEGRIVHYVLKSGEYRAAMVVRAWHKIVSREYHDDVGLVNLYVFLDGTNDHAGVDYDGVQFAPGTLWATSVHYSEMPTPGTWHWMYPGQATQRQRQAEAEGRGGTAG